MTFLPCVMVVSMKLWGSANQVLSFLNSVWEVVLIPTRRIASTQKLVTHLSQLLPFKRKMRKNRGCNNLEGLSVFENWGQLRTICRLFLKMEMKSCWQWRFCYCFCIVGDETPPQKLSVKNNNGGTWRNNFSTPQWRPHSDIILKYTTM